MDFNALIVAPNVFGLNGGKNMLRLFMELEEIELSGRECEWCGDKIPQARIDALPRTTRCVKCSVEKGKIGVIVSDSDGCTADIQICEPDDDYANIEISRGKHGH